MNITTLNKQLKYWQDKLGLSHWNIILKVVRHYEVSQDATATASIDQFHEKAVINLIDTNDVDPESPSYEEAEVLVIHELLHCILEPTIAPEGSAQHLSQERSINRLARLLQAMNGKPARRKRKKGGA